MRKHPRETDNAGKKIGAAEHKSENDTEVVLICKEIKQYCYSMIPVLLLFFSMMSYPALPGLVRLCSGVTFLIAVGVVISTSIPLLMNISDGDLLRVYVSRTSNFNHFMRTLVHVLWLNIADDFIFGRILTLFLLPLSSARQSHSPKSLNVYICVHVALTLLRFRLDFEDGLPWMLGSIICCSMFVDIALQKEQHQSSRLRLAGAWRAMEKLLSGFCDAVVRLDANMCIQHPSPQLTYLLHPDGSLARTALHGKCFTDYFASASDRECFEDSKGHNGLPVALQVGLINGNSGKHVELFHVHSKGVYGCEDHHLIGVREMQETACSEAASTNSRGSGHVEPVIKNECALGKDEDCMEKPKMRTLKDLLMSECQQSAPSWSSESSHSQKCAESSDISFMQFDIDGIDLDVHSYSVSLNTSSSQKNAGTSMVSLVVPAQRVNFTKWFQLSSNSILYDEGNVSKFGTLYFRIPSRCGGRSSDIFVARSASVHMINKPEIGSDDDSGNGMFPEVRLHCENVVRIKLSQSSNVPLEPIQEDLGAKALRQRVLAKSVNRS